MPMNVLTKIEVQRCVCVCVLKENNSMINVERKRTGW